MKFIPSKVEKQVVNEEDLKGFLNINSLITHFSIKSDFISEKAKKLEVFGTLEERLNILKSEIIDYCECLPHSKFVVTYDLDKEDKIDILIFPITSAA